MNTRKNKGKDYLHSTGPDMQSIEGHAQPPDDVDSNTPDPGNGSNDKYVLIGHYPIELDTHIYKPGDKIGEDVFQKMPRYLKPHWREIGQQLPQRIYNKLPPNSRKFFKLKP